MRRVPVTSLLPALMLVFQALIGNLDRHICLMYAIFRGPAVQQQPHPLLQHRPCCDAVMTDQLCMRRAARVWAALAAFPIKDVPHFEAEGLLGLWC